jgi:hypothetical protein
MKSKPTKPIKLHLLYYGFIGTSVSLTSSAITKWGKATLQNEGITIFLSILCIVITHIIWFKYIRKNEAVSTKKFLFAMWMGIAVGTGCSLLLQSLPF